MSTPIRSITTLRPTLAVTRAIAVILLLTIALPLHAQSLEERLDERRYLDGLRELDLPEILEHYRERHRDALDAEDQPEELREHLTAARDPALSVAEREAAIERALAERAALIAENPQDRRVAGWLADQATDYYFEYLALEASGWTAILGIPNKAQRERAIRAGKEIHELARRAEAAVEQAILDVERAPGFADNLNLQRERRRLTEQERDRRIPFLIGVGASVRAHADDLSDRERSELLGQAVDVLSTVAGRLDRALAAEARTHAGLAAAKLGRVDEAQRFFDDAETVEEAAAIVRFAARLGRASLRAADADRNLDRLSAYSDYSGSIFYRLLVADRRFALRKDRDLRGAVNAYADIFALNLDVSREAARDIVFARIADAVEDEANADRLPPFAVIARAERDLRRDSASPEPVASLLDRTDLTDLERAHALLTLARVHYRAGDALSAAKRYIEFARDHSAQPEAIRAIELGLALASEQYRSAPQAARDTLHEGLNVALTSYPRLPSIDRWKFVAGRLALNESRYDEAIERLASIARGHELWLDGRVLRVQALRRAASVERDADQRRERLWQLVEATPALINQIDEAAQSAEPDRAAALTRLRLQLVVEHASALTAIDEARKAIDFLTGFEDEPGADGPLIASALQARIEAHQAMGEVAEAQREIDRFLQAADVARVANVLAPMLASIERRVKELQAIGRESQARETATTELAPLAARLDAWMSEHPNRYSAAIALRIADAHRLAGVYDRALPLYDRLLADHPSAAPLLLGKAECLYHLGVEQSSETQLGEAMALYRRIAQTGAELGETYWLAQLRTLQILDATNRNTHQIAPQIQRLRLRDPELGGARFRAEFDRLQSRHAG